MNVDVKLGALRFCDDYNLTWEFVQSHNGTLIIRNDKSKWKDKLSCYYMNHNRAIKDWICRNVRHGDVVVDVGANHGEFTVLFSKLADRVIAFEPLLDNYQYLKRTSAANVQVEKFALSNRIGTDTMQVFTDFSMIGYSSFQQPTSIHHRDFSTSPEVVSVISLDTYLQDNPCKIDFLKVDIEGGELNFFKGANKVLGDHRPLIMCEVSDHRTCDFGYRAAEIIEYVAGFGYRWYAFGSDGLTPVDTSAETLSLECLAIPEERSVTL